MTRLVQEGPAAVRNDDPAKADPAVQRLGGRVIAVVNTAGGGCGPGSAPRMAEVFAQAGLGTVDIAVVAPANVERALKDAAARADVVVALGGDGTLRTAAMACGRRGTLLIPLAGGTMNLLAHALYGARPWDKALANTLAAPRVRTVSGGAANGQPFYCAAVFGTPSLWADAREALRRGDVRAAATRSITAIRRHGDPLDYQFADEPAATAEAVVVICPLASTRQESEERVLEAAALDPKAASAMLSLAFHAIFDDWRLDPSVSLSKVTGVTLSGHGRLPALLDGEKAFLGRQVAVTFVERAFRAIVPATADTVRD